ncbi:SURF1 family protein [Idiomarina seosinensis]|uniref:SURF1 family protein n=1 Tax=Idiomarina seosinensis TaxID=281739 RepID=UPI00384DBC8D
MVKLGFWQLARAEQKQQLFSDYQQGQQLKSDSRVDLALLRRQPDRFEPVSVTGRFDPQAFFLLDNQLKEGQAGYHVIGLLQADSLQAPVPVNLGWVPAPASRQQLPAVELPAQKLNVTGLVRYPEANVFIDQVVEQQSTLWPRRVQQFVPEEITELTGIEMAPYVILLNPQASFGFQRNWQPQIMPAEKHHAYALQWFTLATAALIIFVIAVITTNKQKKEESS